MVSDTPNGFFVQWDGDNQTVATNRLSVQSVGSSTLSQQQNAKYVDPDTVMRSHNATPFFYDNNGEIYAFPAMGDTHDNWIDKEQDEKKRAAMYNAYYQGRIDQNQRIVTFWGSDYKGVDRLGDCLQKLLDKRLINPNTLVSHPKLYGYTVQQVLNHNLDGKSTNVPDMSSYADDMRKLHVLSPLNQERQGLEQKYGKKAVGKTDQWNTQLQKVGAIPVGSSFRRNWTSESQVSLTSSTPQSEVNYPYPKG